MAERRSLMSTVDSLEVALRETEARIAHMEVSSRHEEEKQEAEQRLIQSARSDAENQPFILSVFERHAENKRRCVLRV
jgi:hypothetical protein